MAVVHQIGVAIENARLYQAARQELEERRRAEEALRESGRLYRTTIDGLDEWLHMVDRDLRFVYLNEPFRDQCRKLGIDPDASGKRIGDLFPFLPPLVYDEYRRVIETGQPCNSFESTVVNGRTIFTETRKIPIVEHGQVERVITVIRDVTERKRAEEALRESECLFHATIDALDEWLHVVDRDLRYVYQNKAFRDLCDRLGLESQAIGKRIQDVVSFLPARVYDEMRQVIETGRPHSALETTVVDGRTYYTEARKIPITEQGQVSRIITVIRDVTERKLAEEALRESEERFRAVFAISPIGIALTDLTGRIRDANPALSRMLGYPVEELHGMDFMALVHPEDRADSREIFLGLVGGTRPRVRVEKRFLRKDGSTGWADTSGNVHRDREGRPLFVIGLVQDVTEQKRAEAALRDSELKYRTLFEAESDALFLIDNEGGRMLEINSAAAALYGYSRDEMLRMKNTDLSAQPDETRHATRSGLLRIPLRYHRKKDGTVFPVEITARHFQWLGRAVHLAAIRDITERKRAEDALRDLSHRLLQAQEEERRRIARDLHDSTAQKLAGLIMALGRLEESMAGAADDDRTPIAECLATARDCVQEIRSLSHLLHPPLLDELGLEVALDTYAQGFSKRSGIAVTLDVAADLGRLPGDVELALFRIVQEGLGNVLKHAASPEATVRLARDGDRVLLEIRDRGRGIPPDLLDRIRDRQPSPGMGIAGMQERLDPLGGQLEIDSSPKGTTLRAVVPIPPGRA
jgi:PAS domain S-box-containing protein